MNDLSNFTNRPLRDSNEPKPTDIALLAMELATLDTNQQGRVASTTDKELISRAYDLWRIAYEKIREEAARKNKPIPRKTRLQSALSVRQGFGAGSDDPPADEEVSFVQIVEEKLLPKRVGKKGGSLNNPGHLASPQAVEKAIRYFFRTKRDPAGDRLRDHIIKKRSVPFSILKQMVDQRFPPEPIQW